MLLHTGRVLSKAAGMHYPPVITSTDRVSANTDSKTAANAAAQEGVGPACKV